MTKFFIIPLSLVFILPMGMVGLLFYHGYFDEIDFQETSLESTVLIYDTHLGSYYNVGDTMTRIEARLFGEEGLSSDLGMGIFYDDPKSASEPTLRSILGFNFKTFEPKKFEDLKRKFKVVTLPRMVGRQAEFPYVTTLSFFLGPRKIYPIITKGIKAGTFPNVPIIEVYDLQNKKILFFLSTSEDRSFFDKLLN